MQASLERLIRDVTLVTLALAIALGWSLYQVASGVGALVTTAARDYDGDTRLVALRYSEPLTWDVWGRIWTFGPLMAGLVEFGVVLGVAVLVYRKVDRGHISN